MFARVVHNRRVAVQRDHARVAASADDRPRNPRRRGRRHHRGVRQRIARRSLHHLPTLPRCGRACHCLLRNRSAGNRKDSLCQVDRLFASHIQGMHRHQPNQAGLRANENSRHRPERRKSVKPKAKSKSRRPQPSKKRVEYPAAEVIRQPAPRLRADERRAEHRIHKPAATREGRPAQPHSVRPPAISVSADRIPRTVGVKVRYSRGVVRRVHVLLTRVRCRRHGVFSSSNPAIEIVILR